MSGSLSTAVSAVHRGSSGRHAAPAPEPMSSTLPGGSSAAQARSNEGPDGATTTRSARRANTVLGSTQGDAHVRAAARWGTLFEPYGILSFVKGPGGTDVNPLLLQGVTVAGLMPDSQRYFDIHHTTEDSIDKVNPRELHLGAAALASLIWLVDTQGL